jgi:hypothetical protein
VPAIGRRHVNEEIIMQKPTLPRTLLASALLLAGTAHAQQDIKITVSAGHAPVFLWVKHLKETFIRVLWQHKNTRETKG